MFKLKGLSQIDRGLDLHARRQMERLAWLKKKVFAKSDDLGRRVRLGFLGAWFRHRRLLERVAEFSRLGKKTSLESFV